MTLDILLECGKMDVCFGRLRDVEADMKIDNIEWQVSLGV